MGAWMPPAQKESMGLICELKRPGLELRLRSQDSRQRGRKVAQRGQVLGLILGGEPALRLGQAEGQQEKTRQLGGEGFGGCHTNLWSSAREES